MVPIITLRRTKRTVGVNQLFMDAQIEGMADTDSSYIFFGAFFWREKKRRNRRVGSNRFFLSGMYIVDCEAGKLKSKRSVWYGGVFGYKGCTWEKV